MRPLLHNSFTRDVHLREKHSHVTAQAQTNRRNTDEMFIYYSFNDQFEFDTKQTSQPEART